MDTYPPWFSFTNFFLCKFQNEKARKAALEAEIAALNKEKSKVEAALAKKNELLETAKKSIREGKRMSLRCTCLTATWSYKCYPSNIFLFFASDKIQKAKDITEAKANVAALLSENEILKKQIQDNLQSHEATVLALHESTEAELKKLKAEVKEKDTYLESAQMQGEVDRKAKEALEAEKQDLLSVLSSSIFGKWNFT